jgi:hypothetical protein
VFERRKVSKLLWALKFGLVWLIREILVKLFLLTIVCCLGLLIFSQILQRGGIRCARTDWFVVGRYMSLMVGVQQLSVRVLIVDH